MVYESGFTTRRTYSSRPVVTSYAVSYPTVTKVSRVYKTSYPIYSTSNYTRGTRVISSPVRMITSPVRVIRSPSPVRLTRATITRVVSSPEHISSYIYTTPSIYTSSNIASTHSSYTPYFASHIPRYTSCYRPSTYVYSSPSCLYSLPVTRVYSRSLTPVRVITSPVRVTPGYFKRCLHGYGARALTNYLSTEPFTTFREETDRIRNRTQSLIRDLHTPVVRRTRSMTPFPVTGYEPTTDVAFDAYVSRITNPLRHIAKEVHRMSMYPEPAHKHVDPELDPYRPSRKFSAPRPLEDPVDDETKEKQRLREERLMTLNEEEIDLVEMEKKNAQCADEAKRREQKALAELVKRTASEASELKDKADAARQSETKSNLGTEENKLLEEELKRLAEIENKTAETFKAAQETEKSLKEEQKKNAVEEEEKTHLEEDAKLAEETRLVEVDKLVEDAKQAYEQRIREEEITRLYEIEKHVEEEEREADLARQPEELAEIARQDATIIAQELQTIRANEEEAGKAEKTDRLAEEQRIREKEITRLAEIEKQAEEDREAELARQAAELAEIARQEAEIASQELKIIQSGDAAEELIVETASPVKPKEQEVEPSIELNIRNDDAHVIMSTEEEAANHLHMY